MKNKLMLIATTVLMTAVAMAAQEVNFEYDHSYDFSKVKTFAVTVKAWGDAKTEEYAKEAVARELATKGWTQVPDESSADVLVTIKGAAEDKKIEESFYTGTGSDPDGYTGPAGVSNTRWIEEKLGEGTINVLDTKTRKVVFSGVAVGEISHRSRKNEQTIRKGVEKLFKTFPPKPGA